jgi:hypothetical protein
MSIYYRLWLLLCVAMMPYAMFAQPTVSVDNNCNVVVAGTGGSTGVGGTVGHGGIVVMDYDDDGSFTPNANGATLYTWNLLGDLSFTDTSPGTYSKSVSGAEDIYSHNRRERSSENPGNSFGKRSLGKVSITYEQGPCNNTLEFFIYKQYDDSSLPPIIGPECWVPGVKYTYSVDQIASDNLEDAIGIDMYYWTVTNGDSTIVIGSDETNYYSADRSSITFVAPLVIEGVWEITCCFGRANPWDGNAPSAHSSCVTKIIGEEPTEPEVYIPCVPLGATSFMAYVVGGSIEYDYSWNFSNEAWIFSYSPNGDTVYVNTNTDGTSESNIILTVTKGACGSALFPYYVARSFDSSVSISANDCISAGSSQTFSINLSSNQTIWDLPPGWEIGPGGNPAQTTINVAIPDTASAGQYIISAASAHCPDPSVVDTIYVKPNTPEFITEGGVSPVCVDHDATSPVTYTVTASPGATSYIWSFPEGWTPENDTTLTPTVSVTPAGSATPAHVSVKASVDESCSSDAVNYPVNYNPVEPDDISADCWNFGVDGNTILTVDNAPDPFFGTYEVSVSPSSLLQCPTCYSVDSSTGEITLQTSASATAGSYTVYVKHKVTGTPSCGTSDSLAYPIDYNIINNASISMLPLGYDLYYVVNPPSSPVAYAWFLDCGTTALSGETNPALTLTNGGTPPTSLCVEITKDGCTSRVITTNIGTHSYYSIIDPPSGENIIATVLAGNNAIASIGDYTILKDVKLYPNPNNGSFTLELPHFERAASATVYDAVGAIVQKFNLRRGVNQLEQPDSPAGNYILLLDIDGKMAAVRISIQK